MMNDQKRSVCHILRIAEVEKRTGYKRCYI